ncbi:hypothetical protein Q0F99_03475 [Rathayibacter oskolensis]|uniref:hypothetical protein n=1 Tax=Rathayibacter oskolensis TaxID=1891671 RepID=UPI00265E4BD6|nr:hypothetical protein [Rathayibacter oskolensis]WKK72116.1 hypothetical protein Q0F99_03475 [Rathayibacter oskolensis]
MNHLRFSSLRTAAVALVLGATLAVSGCTTGADDLGAAVGTATPTATPTATASAAPAATECSPSAVTSYAPTGVADSTRLAQIRAAGTLRVGVSADTLLMSARNPSPARSRASTSTSPARWRERSSGTPPRSPSW